MTATRATRAGRPTRHHHRLVNRCVLAVLRSPARRLLDPGLCELEYRGRRSGTRIALPVMYASAGTQTVVLVGDAPTKTWWRNFRRPAPVRIRRSGVVRDGVARVIGPGEPEYLDAARAYTARHGLVPQPTDRLIVIDVAHTPGRTAWTSSTSRRTRGRSTPAVPPAPR